MSKPEYLVKFHGDVARFGCIACRNERGDYVSDMPTANVHHIQDGERKEWAVIPLDPSHHQYGPEAIHGNKAAFRQKFGHEWTLFLQLRSIFTERGIWPYQIENSLSGYAESPHAPQALVAAFFAKER